MPTDLFLALTHPENPRGHPILAALLYAYCPAAARWWLAGADPKVPFDPVWTALRDLAASKQTLKEVLEKYGFGTLVDEARRYIEQVEASRRMHTNIRAPERMPTFTGGRTDLNQRFGLQDAFDKMGGDWRNLFVYTRAWAFLAPDWENDMRFAAPPEFSLERLALTFQGIRTPAFFPAWMWTSHQGSAERRVLGLLKDGDVDQLRFALALRAGPANGKRPWPSLPEVYTLDQETGIAEPFDALLDAASLPDLIQRLAALAGREDGACSPLVALQQSSKCQACGYQAQCYTKTSQLSPLALSF